MKLKLWYNIGNYKSKARQTQNGWFSEVNDDDKLEFEEEIWHQARNT